jgi:putative thioredoxin
MDVTDETFQTDVLARSAEVPVIVDLWAPWCGPCKTLGPMLERAVAATGGAVELAKVNVDDNPRIAQSFGAVDPGRVRHRDGKVADQFIGALPEAQVTAFVQKLLPAPARPTPWWPPATRPPCARRSSSSRASGAPPRPWPGS